ncbi:MAG: M1 family aminopeptidase [Sediminibacterium sp.]|nr:M1 family aminopeptidase [Sediminibacterium sp.]
MKAIFWFDIKSYFKTPVFYVMLVLLVTLAVYGGTVARFVVSENIFSDSPYQISFVTAFLSLTTIFFSTLLASHMLFREADAHFELILFSTPISTRKFILGRLASLLVVSFGFVFLFSLSFLVGQSLGNTNPASSSFKLLHYLYPQIVFCFINTLFVTSVLSLVGVLSANKMLVYVSGLILYIIYMITLVYSGSPLMAQSMPQSEQAQLISAFVDPFGLSAFFQQTSNWTIEQRNTQLVSLSGIFLINRVAYFLVSICLISICIFKFRVAQPAYGRKVKTVGLTADTGIPPSYKPATSYYNNNAQIRAVFSFAKIDLIYIVKSIPFIITVLALLFAQGMELYSVIEKGVRLPQNYASSGLMVSAIIQTFYGLCIFVVLFYAYEIFWRSRNVNFFQIESSTPGYRIVFFAKWFSLSIVLFLFSLLMVSEGIVFQLIFRYPFISWTIYCKVFWICTVPLILLGGLILVLQTNAGHKLIGLGLAAVFTIFMATTAGKTVISFPLLRFLQTLHFDYSDMNGFGEYLPVFTLRLLFGIGITGILVLIFNLSGKELLQWRLFLLLALLGILTVYGGSGMLNGYQAKDADAGLKMQANYEKSFRKYNNLPIPTITDVITNVDLYPEKNAYTVKGTYILENKTTEGIDKILVHFKNDFKIRNATLISAKRNIPIEEKNQLVYLPETLLPKQKLKFVFEMDYEWKAINGHQSFNAIVGNGSFIRISNYYPQFSYQADLEIQDAQKRIAFQLGEATRPRAFSAPKSLNDDFINLDMSVSTSSDQQVIGIGELVKQWSTVKRNHFRYKTNAPIPFRFALSSARYATKKDFYKGKYFEIYYHPDHPENVEHLLKNAKLTMDYCEANFGAYPFRTIRFAEVSSFTNGFAATAYPTTIYMTENTIFHANITSDQQQDVINELAGHELSHLWWGNNQISPDEREGAAMLTETFAMYTEMMVYKKMYGEAKMKDRIEMHLGIYMDNKGFAEDQPLYKVRPGDSHISYSKGAVVMYKLSQLIGEDKVNRALRNFLEKNKYPNAKPVSLDFIRELYLIADVKIHPRIDDLFMSIGELGESDFR